MGEELESLQVGEQWVKAFISRKTSCGMKGPRAEGLCETEKMSIVAEGDTSREQILPGSLGTGRSVRMFSEI